ncbi:MAG: histone H1 [Prevotellaceae bacterium]|jgi:hypothetical protein|nr:histone H1 [Prevotellaceae bacterium]
MEKLVAKLRTDVEVFFTDAQAQIDKGNKAAGTRARKASLELEKALKAFRKQSLDASKK